MNMRRTFILYILFYITTFLYAQQRYTPLDTTDPVMFFGDRITYQNKTITLGAKALYVDGQLSEEQVNRFPYVYNSINEAIKHVTSGTESEPMTIYIAPWVYWVDNPDDPNIRYPKKGEKLPFAIETDCPYLHFVGLTTDPRNVVLGANRGQSQGSYGNFTLMRCTGDGLAFYNLTLGNYCNIDLEYPLLSKLNRKRRMDTITQAQLVFALGDKNEAHNVHFLSRLNLNPLWGGKRTLFDRCYLEMTDDSLCKSAVYYKCDFTFFSSMPFGSTQPMGGAVLLDCDIWVKTVGDQYISKSNRGPASLIDVRYYCDHPIYLGWVREPQTDLRFYQANVTLNGQQIKLEQRNHKLTCDINNRTAIDAYRIIIDGDTLYNTYNLLCGNDCWDPMNVRSSIEKIEQQLSRSLTTLPIHLLITTSADTLIAEGSAVTLEAKTLKMGGYETQTPTLDFEYDKSLLRLERQGNKFQLYSISQRDTACNTTIIARTSSGLEGAHTITIYPKIEPAPAFTQLPNLSTNKEGKVTLNYKLNLTETKYDCSDIRWYRSPTAEDNDAILVKISPEKKPIRQYQLSKNDEGYYLIAEISPRHQVSRFGKSIRTVMKVTQVPQASYELETDFTDFPTQQQYQIKNGFWTVDGHHPKDIEYYKWEVDSVQNWYYGCIRGECGLLQSTRGARLRFTPIQSTYGNMKVDLQIASFKAGQGFGSATGQYMDICIKFDTRNLTGYALRIIRTTKYADAVDFYFVKYTNEKIEQISKAVTTICYRTPCYIHIENQGTLLKATARTDYPLDKKDTRAHKIDISAQMDECTTFGGFAIQHTGSGRGNSSCLQYLRIEWQ